MPRIHHRARNFFDRLPKLNHHSRKVIAVVLPWFSLGLGAMQLIGALALYNLLGSVKEPSTLNAALEQYYNNGQAGLSTFDTYAIYFCIGALLVSAGLFLLAVNGLLERKRFAWRMVLAALAFDFLYGVGQIFVYSRTWGNVLAAVCETAVLFFLLAQVHEHYTKTRRGSQHVQRLAQHVSKRRYKSRHHSEHNPHIRVG